MPAPRKKSTPIPPPKIKKGLLPLIICITITFVVRLLFILEVQRLPFATTSPQIVDSWAYHRWALTVARGNFWGTDVFFLRPIYPYLLALLYTLFGPKVIVVQLFQTLIASISCLLLYQITSRVFNQTAALIAGIFFALCGPLVFYTGTLLYVEITILFSLLTVYLLLYLPERRWLAIPAGISFGILIICRPELLLLLPPLIYWLLRRKNHRLTVALFSLTGLLVTLIIPVRNFIVARDPVLFTAHSGINLYFGNNPAADGTWQPAPELNPGIGFSHEQMKRVVKYVNGQELSWSKASAYWTRQALHFIRSRPNHWLKLLGRKFLLFWSNYEVPNNYYLETVQPFSRMLKFALFNFGIIACLGIIGMVWAWRHRTAAFPLYLFVAGYIFSALVFYVLSRLRAPVLPFLMAFAGYASAEGIKLFRQRKLLPLISCAVFIPLAYLGTNLIPVNRHRYAAQAWTQTGNIYLERHRFKLAIAACQTAIRFEPENPAARYSLIQAYAALRDTIAAEKEFAQLQRIAGNTASGQTLLLLAAARIAIARRDFLAATERYRAALTIDPNNPETNYLLGLVYISLNQLDSAATYLNRAIVLDPENDAARAALQAVHTASGRR